MPDLSILIVNYNTRDELRQCLASIREHHAELEVEVIVVDNASRDGSADMVRHEAPEVQLLEPGRNTWFSGGNNLALATASGEYSLVLNPDTVVLPGALPAMVDYLRQHPQVGGLTCQLRHPDGTVQRNCSRIPRYLDLLLGYTLLGIPLAAWRDRRRERMWYADWDRATTRAVEVIPGSCIMASTALLRRVSLFDERLRMYFTEDDLCRRLLQTGAENHFLADVSILHEEHASTRKVQRLATLLYFNDLITFTRLHHGPWLAWLLVLLLNPTRWALDLKQRLADRKRAKLYP